MTVLRFSRLPLPAFTSSLMVAALAWTPPLAHAADALGDARAWYQKGRCKEAVRLLATAERDPSLGDDARVDVYVLQAACAVALQKPAERDEALDKLVRLRPLHELDAVVASPDVRTALEARRSAWQTREGLVVAQVTLEPPAVRVVLEGTLSRAQRVEVYVRPAGTVALQRVSGEVKGNEARVTVSDAAVWEAAAQAGALELVTEVRDAANIPVARLGDAVHPMSTALTVGMLEPMRASAAAAVTPPPAVAAPPPAAQPAALAVDGGKDGQGLELDEPRKKVNVPKAIVSVGALLGVPLALGAGSLLGSFGLFVLSSVFLFTGYTDLWVLTGGASCLFCCGSGCGLLATLLGGSVVGVLGLLGFFVDVEGPVRTAQASPAQGSSAPANR
jgi:hypothetical protein